MAEPHHYEPDQSLRSSRLAMYAGVSLVGLGAVAIYLGYNGAATNPLVEAQVPYVISGGLFGLALLLLGGIGIAASVVLRAMGDMRRELHAVRDGFLEASHGDPMIARALGVEPAPAAASLNGSVVVAESGSSYHRPDCRVVERAVGVSKIPREQADAQGLHACRVCAP